MKDINNYICSKINESESFSDWLMDNFGYEDLYEYFEDSLPRNLSASNCKKLAEDAYKNMHSNVKREAERAGLDVWEICMRVYNNSCNI